MATNQSSESLEMAEHRQSAIAAHHLQEARRMRNSRIGWAIMWAVFSLGAVLLALVTWAVSTDPAEFGVRSSRRDALGAVGIAVSLAVLFFVLACFYSWRAVVWNGRRAVLTSAR